MSDTRRKFAMPDGQPFRFGDLVTIASTDHTRLHDLADLRGIVLASYAEQFGGHTRDIFTLYVEDRGESSWFDAPDLTLLAHDQLALLAEWQAADAARRAQESDLDWIFAQAPDLTALSGATVDALAQCLGISNLWGAHGEGITYYNNARRVWAFARPFVEAHDKAGYLAACEAWKAARAKYL